MKAKINGEDARHFEDRRRSLLGRGAPATLAQPVDIQVRQGRESGPDSAPAMANAGPGSRRRAAPAQMEDLMKKAVLLVVTYAQANRLARVVVGRNVDWKQNVNLGAKQNPNLHVHPACNVARGAAHEVRPRRD